MGVKEAITELCKLIKALDSSLVISSEDFRLARINSCNSIERMKVVLKVLLLKINLIPTNKNYGNRNIRSIILKTKYPRVDQLFVEDKIVSNRELLCCISYLLSTSQLWLQHILKYCLQPIDPFEILIDSHHKIIRKISESKSESILRLKKEDQVIRVCNVIKKLELMHNRLVGTKAERIKLDLKITNKISEHCKRFNVGTSSELTCTHLLLLSKKPDLIPKFLCTIKRKLQLLRSFIKWKENEIFFWNWVTCSLREQQTIDSSILRCDDCLRLTQINSSQVVLKTMHEKFKQLVSDLKNSQELLQETVINKGKSLGLEEKQRIKLEVNKMFSSVNSMRNEPTITIFDSKTEHSTSNDKPSIDSCDYAKILNSILADLTYRNQQNRVNNIIKLKELFEASSLSTFSKIISIKNVVND